MINEKEWAEQLKNLTSQSTEELIRTGDLMRLAAKGYSDKSEYLYNTGQDYQTEIHILRDLKRDIELIDSLLQNRKHNHAL